MNKSTLVFGLLCLVATTLFSQPPEMITYQGRLLNGTNLVSGVQSISLRLFNSSSGGTQLYAETQAVTVVDGLYSVRLGQLNPTPGLLVSALTNANVYLEIQVGATTLSPREQIVAVAYALTSVSKTGDKMTGPLEISSGGDNELVITSAGSDIMLGQAANGDGAGVAVGSYAYANAYGVGIGYTAQGISYAVAVGNGAVGSYDGVAVGHQSYGTNFGCAIGFSAEGSETGAVVGAQADGRRYGSAVGYNANGADRGAALGDNTIAMDEGIAIGHQAWGRNTNVAIGVFAKASGNRQVAIGYNVTNNIDNSTAVRGSLYLDGGTGIFYRSVFGMGTWNDAVASAVAAGSTGFVRRIGDTMTGPLVIKSGAWNHLIINGESAGVLIGSGSTVDVNSVSIGNGNNAATFSTVVGRNAKADSFGVAMGANAIGNNYGVGIGYDANGEDTGVAIGTSAGGQQDGVAIGWSANGQVHSVAVGYSSASTNYGASLGDGSGGRNYGAAVGASASGGDNGAALGYNAQGTGSGVAVGRGASGGANGVAVGYSSVGYNGGVGVGYMANAAQQGNVAVGFAANAGSGWHTVALGESVTNSVYDSARIRGTLYLDGATGILYRTTFGTGGWSNMMSNFAERDPFWVAASNGIQTQISAGLASNVWASAGSTTNYVRRTGDEMLGVLSINHGLGATTNLFIGSSGTNIAIGGGSDATSAGTAIGQQANAYMQSVAAGENAQGYWYSAAVGQGATGRTYGAVIGQRAFAYQMSVALGFYARGSNYATAVGAATLGDTLGVAVGYGARGLNGGIGIGANAWAQGTNIAIGLDAWADPGSNRVALGRAVTNNINNSVAIRGSLYMDGATGIQYRTTFGTGGWTNYPEWVWATLVTNVLKQTNAASGAVTNFVVQTGSFKVLK